MTFDIMNNKNKNKSVHLTSTSYSQQIFYIYTLNVHYVVLWRAFLSEDEDLQ